MTPGFDEVNGASRISVSGSASMSARQAMVRPGRSPCSTPTTPVRPRPVRTSNFAAWSRSAMISAVRRSSKESSGWRWKSRRRVTKPSRRRSISCVHSVVSVLMSTTIVLPRCLAKGPPPRGGRWSEADRHLRPEHERILDGAIAAGTDDVLQIRHDRQPPGEEELIVRLDHGLGRRAAKIATECPVNHPDRRDVGFTAGDETLIAEPSAPEQRQRAEARSRPHGNLAPQCQSLLALGSSVAIDHLLKHRVHADVAGLGPAGVAHAAETAAVVH